NYYKGSWKFKQDIKTVIIYLNLNDPETNYLYKATEVKEFAQYLNYGDDIGNGANFSLKKYYKMCNEIVKELKNYQELINIHKKNLPENSYVDNNLHILCYDLIFCAKTYNLLYNVELPQRYKKLKKKSNNKDFNIDKEKRKEEIKEKEKEISNITKELEKFKNIDTTGVYVNHKKYGSGLILDLNYNKARIEFNNIGIKLFDLPLSLHKNILNTDNNKIKETFSNQYILLKKKEKILFELKLLKGDL
ncbi:MAG: hypothetical protein ACOCP4_05650, partial [Candidatus Woesearchaeota archaeon]